MEAAPLNKASMLLEITDNSDWKIRQKKILTRCVCGLASLIIVAVILGLLIASVSLERKCNNRECLKYSKEILLNMDATINPCDNFYKFACGNYAANNPLPDDENKITSFSKSSDLLEKQLTEVLKEPIEKNEAKHFQDLKKYYQSCINTERIEEIGLRDVKKILQALGGWPVVEDLNPNIGWDSVLFGLKEIGLDSDYLMRVFVHTDFKNSTVRILGIEPPSFQLSRALLIKGKSDETIKAYYDFMVQTAMAFGADEDTAKQHMDLALDFEIYLAKSSKSPEDIAADISALHNLYSIEELEVEFPGVPWSDYIRRIAPKSLNIPATIEVNLFEPDYTKSLMEILKITPARVIRNYIIWRAIWYMVPFLNKEVRDLEMKFIEVVYGITKLPQSNLCLRIIHKLYLTVESAIYVRKYFDQHSKAIASELVVSIRDQFEKTLNNTKWSEEDKAKAIEKIQSLYAHVGFPNELLDDKKLNSLYETLQINEDFLQSSLNIIRFQSNFEFNRLFEPINKTDWTDFSISAKVNALYQPKLNAIVIPAAILQGNFFNAKLPRYINFGAIGTIIGHEISHGFDNIGRQYNKEGAIERWWSEIAEQDFAEKARCLVEQYNNFTMFGEKINGNLTVGENIADFGGQKTAYLSYQNWRSRNNEEPGLPGLNYTNNQLFWIAAASIWCSNEKDELIKYQISSDEHSPKQLRVNGPMSNLEMFSKDFNCPTGSNMNPEKKCTPW